MPVECSENRCFLGQLATGADPLAHFSVSFPLQENAAK